MKKKIIFKLFVFLILFELLFIVAISGYAVIKEVSLKSAFSEIMQQEDEADKKDKEQASDPDSDSSASSSVPVFKPYKPKQEFTTVDASYFNDALFIGDSRTVALRAYSSFTDSYYFAKTGIGVNALFEYPARDESTGLSLKHILSQRQYGKIYIMIGVNDLSYGTLETFEESYFAAIDQIREYQPSAIIYVQSIVGITIGKERNSPYNFNNQMVIDRNAVLKSRCDGEKIVFLDLFSAFADETGYLNPEYTADGLHIKPDYTYLWEDFLKANALKTEE